ncbi:MAG: ATP-binding protein, partial [Anaerotignum sp.]|nr:ATP-binding protein [Anaerotignum sp.]
MATRTQIYKEVLREYDALRTLKAAELRERREAIYMKLPRLEEIERELSLLGVSTAKLVLMQPESREVALAELQEKQNALKTERDELMAKNCLSPSLLKLEYACETCKDTGYVEDKQCACMKHKLMDRLYDQSNVRDIIKLENFDTFDLRLFSDEVVKAEGISPKENAQRNLRMAMAFAEDFSGDNLLLYGGSGRGKTFLCNCIAKDVLDRGKTVLYLTAGQLFKQLEELRFHRDEEEETLDWDVELLDADLLIIDDLGT